jgi:hypothetical protein
MLRQVVRKKLADLSEVLTAFIIRANVVMMEAVSILETSISFYQTTRIPADTHLPHLIPNITLSLFVYVRLVAQRMTKKNYA